MSSTATPLTRSARPRRCAFAECRAVFTPRRRDQRFHKDVCARAYARRMRRARNARARQEAQL